MEQNRINAVHARAQRGAMVVAVLIMLFYGVFVITRNPSEFSGNPLALIAIFLIITWFISKVLHFVIWLLLRVTIGNSTPVLVPPDVAVTKIQGLYEPTIIDIKDAQRAINLGSNTAYVLASTWILMGLMSVVGLRINGYGTWGIICGLLMGMMGWLIRAKRSRSAAVFQFMLFASYDIAAALSGVDSAPVFTVVSFVSVNAIRGTFCHQKINEAVDGRLPKSYQNKIVLSVFILWAVVLGLFVWLDMPGTPKITDQRVRWGYQK
jgi:hypothetical protein